MAMSYGPGARFIENITESARASAVEKGFAANVGPDEVVTPTGGSQDQAGQASLGQDLAAPPEGAKSLGPAESAPKVAEGEAPKPTGSGDAPTHEEMPGGGPAGPEAAHAGEAGTGESDSGELSMTPEQELNKLIAEQAADMAEDVGLTDVEPGAANILERPEYQRGVEAASEAFERLPNIEQAKNVAGTPGGEPKTSGWAGEKMDATERAYVEGMEAGHETEPHAFDPKGAEGQYESSHSERQQAAGTSDQEFASSKPMCPQCQGWFGDRASAEGRPQFVADPTGVHVFTSDGRHIVTPHPSGAVTMP
jgi:hypothetical protein